ncbi:MlaD family protein [Mycobacterium vicinigordonae]|uniref:MlaD family protein n=1 Tax=Mycobacterium vicinigordonae TaxID=1719132 RepID=UPI001FEB800A|nr:mammalian cell entry protein [Mycobacterium vicinigordonae]
MLAIIGGAMFVVVIASTMLAQLRPFHGRVAGQISVAFDTPYAGQGVQAGTPVVLHGVKVGRVTEVSNRPGGGIRLLTELQKRPVSAVTNATGIDFRPINYFGVPGINLTPVPNGAPLRDGMEIQTVPKGNFTLTEMLSQLGDVTANAITPRLISVIDRATRYTDGLNPLFETMLTVTRTVAHVQRVSTAQLLSSTAAASDGAPPAIDAGLDAGQRFVDNNLQQGPPPGMNPAALPDKPFPPYLEGVHLPSFADFSEKDWQTAVYANVIAANDMFGGLGRMESSHVDDLLPLVKGFQSLTDVVPSLVRPGDFGRTITELRTRFERLYAGNGDQRALQVRVVLDSLPGVAAPLGIVVERGR